MMSEEDSSSNLSVIKSGAEDISDIDSRVHNFLLGQNDALPVSYLANAFDVTEREMRLILRRLEIDSRVRHEISGRWRGMPVA